MNGLPLVPAQAGTQSLVRKNWIPAFAGMSGQMDRAFTYKVQEENAVA
jgi:hypothetical protein